MGWIYYSLAAALALAAADILVKLAAGKLPDSLGMLLYGTVPFVTGLTWFTIHASRAGLPAVSRRAVLYAFAVGIMYSTVTFCMYVAFRTGAPISLASPLVRLGGLILAGLAGLIFWKEPVTIRYLAGTGLVCLGLYLMLTR
jgi:uncharacterized membrane protein